MNGIDKEATIDGLKQITTELVSAIGAEFRQGESSPVAKNKIVTEWETVEDVFREYRPNNNRVEGLEPTEEAALPQDEKSMRLYLFFVLNEIRQSFEKATLEVAKKFEQELAFVNAVLPVLESYCGTLHETEKR